MTSKTTAHNRVPTKKARTASSRQSSAPKQDSTEQVESQRRAKMRNLIAPMDARSPEKLSTQSGQRLDVALSKGAFSALSAKPYCTFHGFTPDHLHFKVRLGSWNYLMSGALYTLRSVSASGEISWSQRPKFASPGFDEGSPQAHEALVYGGRTSRLYKAVGRFEPAGKNWTVSANAACESVGSTEAPKSPTPAAAIDLPAPTASPQFGPSCDGGTAAPPAAPKPARKPRQRRKSSNATYLDQLERVVAEFERGGNPQVDNEFAQIFLDCSRATLYRKLNKDEHGAATSGGRRYWLYAEILEYRDGRVGRQDGAAKARKARTDASTPDMFAPAAKPSSDGGEK